MKITAKITRLYDVAPANYGPSIELGDTITIEIKKPKLDNL